MGGKFIIWRVLFSAGADDEWSLHSRGMQGKITLR